MSGRIAKKIRREVKEMRLNLASDLKTWLAELPFYRRFVIGYKIFVGRKW